MTYNFQKEAPWILVTDYSDRRPSPPIYALANEEQESIFYDERIDSGELDVDIEDIKTKLERTKYYEGDSIREDNTMSVKQSRLEENAREYFSGDIVGNLYEQSELDDF